MPIARLSRSRAAPLLLAVAIPAAGADIYVVEMHVERPDGPTLEPTFLATPGEDAVAELDGGALDVSVLLSPGTATAADAPFELRLAIDRGEEHLADTFDIRPSEQTSVKLGDYSITLTVRVQD